MDTTRAGLLTRKQEVLDALRLLEQDYDDGLMDEEAYHTAYRRYEREVAEILSRLDAMPARAGKRQDPRKPMPLGIIAAALISVAGLLLFLLVAVGPRLPGQVMTGSVSNGDVVPANQASVELENAQRTVYRHPTSYTALLGLGAAYMDNGRTAEADLTYQAAMRIAPNRPEAPTFHAMLLGTIKRYGPALLLLQRIERSYPAYPQAWLIDGILSRRVHGGNQRALQAWLRFLMLSPNSDLAPRVRRWIAQLEAKKR